ncbi:hypothetical protein LAT59_03060, partial [Candidatus Gracilibacteria bacterium]|nr:hypothetical protein [Candidatus Gracilibacteria bacterium]
MKRHISLSLIFLLPSFLFFPISSISADSSAARNNRDPGYISTNILPDIYGAQETERGFIGSIIANMFADTGRIKSTFIDAFVNLVTPTANMHIPYWNNGNFVPGAIRQTAGINGNIGIGITPHSSARLRVDGVSLFSGLINANAGIGAATNLSLIAS